MRRKKKQHAPSSPITEHTALPQLRTDENACALFDLVLGAQNHIVQQIFHQPTTRKRKEFVVYRPVVPRRTMAPTKRNKCARGNKPNGQHTGAAFAQNEGQRDMRTSKVKVNGDVRSNDIFGGGGN